MDCHMGDLCACEDPDCGLEVLIMKGSHKARDDSHPMTCCCGRRLVRRG